MSSILPVHQMIQQYDHNGAFREGAERGKQSRIAQLAGQAQGATGEQRNSLLQSMAYTDPKAAEAQRTQFRQIDQDAATDLATDAGRFVALAQMGDPATIDAAYAQLAAKASGVMGHQLPAKYDPQMLAGIQKIAGASQAALPTSVQEYQYAQQNPGFTGFLAEKSAASQRPQYGNYNGTPIQFGPDGFTPVGPAGGGAPQPQAAPQPQPGQRQYAPQGGDQTAIIEQEIGRQLSPQERAQIANGTFNLSVPVGQQAPAPQQYAQAPQANSIYDNPTPPIELSAEIKSMWAGLSPQQRKAAVEAKAGVGMTPVQANADRRAESQADLARRAADRADRIEARTASTAKPGAGEQKAAALRVYEVAINGLKEGLEGTATGPLAGMLPAMTTEGQIAEGGIAAMAPVLKDLFRQAGEGTFTKDDQAILMAMLPSRKDTPEARKSKLANVDAIVRAKLGGASAPASAQPAQGGGWSIRPKGAN